MKARHSKESTAPVVEKGYTCTLKEQENLKKRVLDEIEEHDIRVCRLPDAESCEDEDFKEQTRLLRPASLSLWLDPISCLKPKAGRSEATSTLGASWRWRMDEAEDDAHHSCAESPRGDPGPSL